MSVLAEPRFVPPAAPPKLVSTIQQVVRAYDAEGHAGTLGPSEIGQPCGRRLAYRMLGVEPVNVAGDPWPAIVGTAVHAWLAEAFRADNTRLGRTRWLVEERVQLSPAITGRCDLYDGDNANVTDHKVAGATTMKRVKAEGPGQLYRTQVHLYGYGHAQAGRRVETVSIAFYPRSGWLDGLHVWSEPYDEQTAIDALGRLLDLAALALLVGVDQHPDRWPLLPEVTGPGCVWCPYFRPGRPADDAGCPGDLTADRPTVPFRPSALPKGP